jgi:uncharacterized protein (TIGR03435 family)
MNRMSRALLSLVLVASLAHRLSSQQLPQFDVASVREASAPVGVEGGGREKVEVTPKSVWLRNATLSFCIQWAYGIRFYQVSGPRWLSEARYEILAKTQEPRSQNELRLMMRALLADRFKLVLEHDRQPRPVYSLVLGKGQPQFQKAAEGTPSTFAVTDGDFVFGAHTMPEFAERLSDFATVDRPVIDKTSLEGAFHFRLVSAARAIRSGEGPSIFTAVSEIGLQLKPATEAMEVVVVESAERHPSAN